VRKYLRPGFAAPYGVATALAVVSIVFFGWAGFWLGLAIVALVKAARWGVPLIRLSYAPARQRAEEPQPSDDQPAPAAR
jgi:hypothetical protein